jgi:hypothetical protein
LISLLKVQLSRFQRSTLAENAAAEADLLIHAARAFSPARLSAFTRRAHYARISTCQQYLHRLTLILACTHENNLHDEAKYGI